MKLDSKMALLIFCDTINFCDDFDLPKPPFARMQMTRIILKLTLSAQGQQLVMHPQAKVPLNDCTFFLANS